MLQGILYKYYNTKTEYLVQPYSKQEWLNKQDSEANLISTVLWVKYDTTHITLYTI